MARSDLLVTADWAQSNLDAPNVVFVEVDEDTSAYDTGHIAGAIRLDWRTDLQDPVKRDFVDAQQFSKLLSDRGICNDDTVILYGGNNNWFAAYAYWYFKLYADAGLDGTKETIAYCRIGERSSHTWFVLQELLGHKNVKNYDGSWTEYGSLVGAPIELGS